MTAERRPNILVILTDEERERIWAPDDLELPARDRLDRRGLRLTGHHIHAQPCTPSRSTIVTGRHVAHTGMGDNINFHWQPDLRAPAHGGLATWATMLRTAGYRSSWLGKWHLGGATRHHGLRPFGFEDWRAPDVHGVPMGGLLHDHATAAQAVRWLDEHGDDPDPWLLVVSFVNPHDIWLYPRFADLGVPKVHAPLPATLHDDLADKPEAHRTWRDVCDLTAGRVVRPEQWQRIADAYLGLQLEVDRHIGRVLDRLDRSAAGERTVVVRTSDHGDMAGAHGLRQKGPFVYREAVNVPLTIAWPGRTDGRRSDQLTAAIDLAPTLCDVAGIAEDEARERWQLPGRSLLPLLDRPEVAVREAVLFTADAQSSMGPGGTGRGFLRGCTDGRWKVARYFAPGGQDGPIAHQELELYDLARDPHEERNLAADPAHRPIVDDALARLTSLVADEVGDDDFVPRKPTGVPRSIRALQRYHDLTGRLRGRHPQEAPVPAPPDAPLAGVTASTDETIERLAGRGAPMWPEALVLAVDVDVDAAAAAAWLPPGLRVPRRPGARLFVADYAATSFGVAYREAGVLLHAESARRRTPVLHCCWMTVDDDSALIYGRELLGFPKKLAAIDLAADPTPGAGVGARVERRGQTLLAVEGVSTAAEPDAAGLLDRPIANVWGLPGPLPGVLLHMAPGERVHQAARADVVVDLPGGDHDPLGSLGVRGREAVAHVLRTDLGVPPAEVAGARPTMRQLAGFVRPMRAVGPAWITRHYLARSR